MTPARLVASGFGTGLSRIAPGTVASVVAVIIGAGMLRISPYILPLAAVAATLGGLWAVKTLHAGDDPGWIVIDEYAGQWIAMLAIPHPTLYGLLAAFLLFRLLDISKPGPVGWADRQKSPVGVMADDVIAGAMAAAILLALQATGVSGLSAKSPSVIPLQEKSMIGHTILLDAEHLLQACREKGLHLATAESCTGGLIAATLTAIAGSSDVVDRGFVTYTNDAKTELLGVPSDLIETVGAVSEAVARRMAQGALDRSSADLTVAVTGIAGPGGGTAEKPVGLVWFGLAQRGHESRAEKKVFPGDRAAVRAATVGYALGLVKGIVDSVA